MDGHVVAETAAETAVQQAPARRARNEAVGNGALKVTCITERARFVALQEEWDALVERTEDQVFYRHAFFRVWLDNFAPRADLRVFTVRDGTGRLVATLPLVRARMRLHGVPVRVLTAAANEHSCRFDLLAEDPGAAARALLPALLGQGDWDLIRLTDVPEAGRAYALLKEAAEAKLPTGTWASLASPYVPLPSSKEALQKGMDSKFRANLRRRRKRLAEKGAVTLERVTSGPGLPAQVEEGMALEASGWKGRGGTAMAQDPSTRGFYLELARTMAAEGRLALWFMRLDGRAVGFHYALEHGGKYLLLKPGYDEAIRECSPGQLLVEDVLGDCVERGLGEFDFLGIDMPWKRDWTDRVRDHLWLFIFRGNAFGRGLHALKFRFGPRVREMVKTWKR